MRAKGLVNGFTLIELLIVIAIILILISIALPNFLEAQARARLARVRGDQRGLVTAVEAFRTERGVLLIDFWDDETKESRTRWRDKFGQVGQDPMTGYDRFEECYYPLTSPARYMTKVPYDLFNDPKRQVGLSGGEIGLGYIYFDNDPLFPKVYDYFIDRFFPGHPLQVSSQTRPLSEGEFGILSVGPDGFIGNSKDGKDRAIAYNPTNGTMSTGDMVMLCNGRQ
jgi:prepilin-type N-terminal cleavage/methylation domain-containing protein